MSLTIKLKPADLVVLVKANREKFLERYNIALDGYFKDLNAYSNALKKCAKDKTIPKQIYPPSIPDNHLKDYDTTISMIAADQSETIDISQEDYRQYVLDEWTWKDIWSISNSKYFTP
jgi:hypothetical protein